MFVGLCTGAVGSDITAKVVMGAQAKRPEALQANRREATRRRLSSRQPGPS